MTGTTHFAQNLTAALKSLNLSGGGLSSTLGVDKSVVRRWVLGRTRPTAVNMARLSQMVATRIPGFSVGDWDLDPGTFAARMAPGALGQAVVAMAPGPMFRSFAGFREAVDSEAPVYLGYWMAYVMDTSGSGRVIARATRVSRDGHRMPVEMVGGEFTLNGELFAGANRMYVLTDGARAPSLSLQIFNGAPRAVPDLIVGISTFLARDTNFSPTAAPVVSEFRGRFSGDPERDDRLWRALIDEANSFGTPQDVDRLSPRIRKALSFRVLAPDEEGEGSPVMRMPPALAG